MNKFSFTPSNLVYETDISEMERLFNGMWTEIMENKYDVLAYCSSSDNTFKISKIHMKDERIDVRLSYVSRAAIFLKNNATFTGGLRADPWQINSENAGVL